MEIRMALVSGTAKAWIGASKEAVEHSQVRHIP